VETLRQGESEREVAPSPGYVRPARLTLISPAPLMGAGWGYRVDTSFDVLAVRQIDSVVLKSVAVAWKA
jgi:hypothetical protein